jgi:ribosomal protein S18 acetylase RimI-like enzyme
VVGWGGAGTAGAAPPRSGGPREDLLVHTWTPRRATDADVEEIARVWHDAWRDGHVGHIPESLVRQRTLDEFVARVPPRVPATHVIDDEQGVVGFVTVKADELEELFVDRRGRGTGVAVALLSHGEQIIAERYPVAWLAVVAGNARARHFYERQGWHDSGPLAYIAETSAGPATVPTRRYQKQLSRAREPVSPPVE